MTTKAKTRRLRMPQARTGMLQFLIFLALSAIVIPYGINFIAGPEGFGDKLVLTARMDDAFGLSAGTGVTLRGVDIGTVRSVELDPAGGAADIELVVRGDTRIPADSYMQVTMASMAGIQSVDIIPSDNDAPYLKSGDTIAAPADKQPKQMDAIIGDAASVLRSIGSGNLTTLGNEFYAAFDHDEKALASIVSNGTALAGLVNRNAPILQGLFDEWLQVLSAMSNTTTAFEAGMRSAATFTDQLDANQPVFVYLLDKSPESLTRTQALFDKYRGTFGGVMANLAVVEPIISDHDQSLAVGLETIPPGSAGPAFDREERARRLRAHRHPGTGLHVLRPAPLPGRRSQHPRTESRALLPGRQRLRTTRRGERPTAERPGHEHLDIPRRCLRTTGRRRSTTHPERRGAAAVVARTSGKGTKWQLTQRLAPRRQAPTPQMPTRPRTSPRQEPHPLRAPLP
ncbi:MlaD family protein [Gordonia sp. GONU]|uniref:MlaD family protein n=1 Tax=Gordonia sp. GONU TaxID=2972949 RepID=UPI0021AC6ADF|nr:MlaD family protein [Gordonia sp. GONU]MCR8896879.1 MlaD family protein [Gordonia sp. GONU]